jgi:prophage regulatory protein
MAEIIKSETPETCDPTQIDPLLRIKKVEELTGYGRRNIYHLISKDKFPKQVRLGPKAVAWRASDIRAWINQWERVE